MLTRLRTSMADERGVTMIELFVVILLMGIVGSVATTSMVRGMKVSAATQARFTAVAALQKSVDRMTRELRAAAPVQVALPTRAVVVVFRNPGGTTAPAANNFNQQVRFTYDYCPTQGRIHVRRQAWPATTPTASIPPQLSAINCATTSDPVLVDRVVNPVDAVPTTQLPNSVFKYFRSDGVTETANLSEVRQIQVRVIRSLPNEPASRTISVVTKVRLRNVR